MPQLLVQLIGITGAAIFIFSYQIKSNKKLYFAQIFANVLFIIQFYFLGGMSGSLCTFLCVVRNALLMKVDKWKFVGQKATMVIFCLMFVAASIVTWNGIISIFPVIACVSNTIGYWTNNARYIRITSGFVCSPAWLTYDIYTRSIGGTINDSLTIISVIISIVRFGWKNLGNEDFGKQ